MPYHMAYTSTYTRPSQLLDVSAHDRFGSWAESTMYATGASGLHGPKQLYLF